MSNNNHKPISRLSYAGRHSDLYRGTPVSLREVKPASLFFNDQADPLHKAQRKALQQSESERREAMSQGSLMVKLHKPFPELKPHYAHSVLKASFNQSWLKERKRSALQHLQQQENTKRQNENPYIKIQSLGYEPE